MRQIYCIELFVKFILYNDINFLLHCDPANTFIKTQTSIEIYYMFFSNCKLTFPRPVFYDHTFINHDSLSKYSIRARANRISITRLTLRDWGLHNQRVRLVAVSIRYLLLKEEIFSCFYFSLFSVTCLAMKSLRPSVTRQNHSDHCLPLRKYHQHPFAR